jgi:chromosome segregation ATPase
LISPKKLSSEHKIETTEFIEAAIHLMNLERTFNKSYQTLLKEYQENQLENKKLLQQNSDLKKQNSHEKEKLEKTKKELQKIKNQIKRVLSQIENIYTVPLSKLSDLAKFIPTFESLGYKAETIRFFAEISDKLKELDIDPQFFHDYLADRIGVEKQIRELNKTIRAKRDEVATLEHRINALLSQNQRLVEADRLIRTNIFRIACKNCDREFSIRARSFQEYVFDDKHQIYANITCPFCGFDNDYNALDQMSRIAGILMPLK